MAKVHRDRCIRHTNATPVGKFPFGNVGQVQATLTERNVWVLEIGDPYAISPTCYGLQVVAKIDLQDQAREGNVDQICHSLIVKLSSDLAKVCGAKSKQLLPTLAIRDADNGDEQIYSIVFAAPLFPSLNDIKRIFTCNLPVKFVMAPTDFYQDRRFFYARADFLDVRVGG